MGSVTVNIWRSYLCTAVEETKIMNTTELVVEIRPEKNFQTRTGFEPMTSAIPVQRSTNY